MGLVITSFIGWRYAWSRHRHGFLSFVSISSVLGLMLGVAILLTVCSVMNGFNHEVRLELAQIGNHITVLSHTQKIDEKWLKVVQNMPEVLQVSPYRTQPVLLTQHGEMVPSYLHGVRTLPHFYHDKKGSDDTAIPFSIVLSHDQFMHLGRSDHVTLVLPQKKATGLFSAIPRFRRMKVLGVMPNGEGQQSMAYTSLATLERLQGHHPSPLYYKIVLHHPLKAPALTQRMRQRWSDQMTFRSWTEDFAAFFHALALEKTLLFVLLSFIVLISAFSLVASLVMMVMHKRADIAILRSMGLSTAQTLGIFMAQGMLMSLLGVMLGLALGQWMSHHITAWVQTLEHALGQTLIDPSVFVLDHLPAIISSHDVYLIATVALGISFVATLYPAFRAAKINPVSVLKGEGG